MDIIFASNNSGKIREVRTIFKDIADFNLYSLGDIGVTIEVVEDKETFKENAMKKALEVYAVVKKPVIAEDSGLCVDALDGRPGVYSHRYYANLEDGNQKLLDELKVVPFEKRNAYYIAVLCYFDGKNLLFSTGTCSGKIGFREEGNNGFAYDKIFFLEDYRKTMAQLSDDEKNRISHRRKALDEMKNILLGEHRRD